jgi:hypothetical protein
MIELIQFPWSPFCIVQRRILEFSGAPFKIINIPNADRSLVWKLTKQRYYGVPIIRDGKNGRFLKSPTIRRSSPNISTRNWNSACFLQNGAACNPFCGVSSKTKSKAPSSG